MDFNTLAGKQIILQNDVYQDVMQLRVGNAKTTDTSSLLPALRPIQRIRETQAVNTRMLMLGEIDDLRGDPAVMLLNDTHWSAPVTEKPMLDSVEIWNLLNVTNDAHAIHLHLARFQILDRRRFEPFAYQSQKVARYLGSAVAPEPGESGWKDTVRADPGMTTRIIIPFEGYSGRYVWHHILEHEDNEMMRPYDVIKP